MYYNSIHPIFWGMPGIFERLPESSLGEPNEEKFEPDLALCFMVKITKSKEKIMTQPKRKMNKLLAELGIPHIDQLCKPVWRTD